jgi:hypothetical protein
MRSNNNNKLKAFVRFDGSGRIVPSSLIVQAFKPKVGNYRQINSKECCLNNECSAPVYGDDWIVYDIVDVPTGVVFSIATNPFENYTLQAQFVSCETGNGIGDIATIGPDNGYELEWFIPIAIWDASCALQVRHVCGPDFYSSWQIQLG